MEVLFPRRPPIHYVSPAACEVIISGSGFGNLFILLSPFGRIKAVHGLVVSGSGPFTLDWDDSTTTGDEPPVLCYNVYKLDAGVLTLVAECVTGGPVSVPGAGDYVVTPVTPEGEGPGVTIGTPVPPGGGGGDGGGGDDDDEDPPGDPDCIAGWKLVETMNPQFSLTWFNGGNPLPAGNYKLVYVSGWLFDSPFSACGPGMYELETSFRLRWNDGSNQKIDPWEDGLGCFASAAALEAAASGDPYLFSHSSGKIGLNPDGSNGTTAALYVACP